MALFAVSDIHGYYKELMEALNEKGFFESDENRLIVLGDALDRGKEANQVVDLLLRLRREGRLVFVLGNHEHLLSDCLDEISDGRIFEIACGMSHHYSNGTFDTALQLSGMTEKEALKDPNGLVRRVKGSEFYRSLLPWGVNFYETDKYVFCHGWIPTYAQGVKPYVKHSYNEGWREASDYDWERASWLNGMERACRHKVLVPGKTVVCGHFHTSWGHCYISKICSEWKDDAIFDPFCADGIIAIDASTANSGKVNCIIIEE